MSIQTKADRQKFSRLRHSLIRLAEEVTQLIESFLSDKPVIRGSVYELKRKCGKPRCKCAQGQLHSTMVVSASEKGRTRLRGIRRGFLPEVKSNVRRYQQLRRARSRLGEVHRKMLHVMNEIETMRREEIPDNQRRSSPGVKPTGKKS